MADHETPGSSLSKRLASRSGLHRTSMGDGGEVYKGPLARRALRALRARAFTMDETIIVDDDFDPSRPEDQALYAHERLHQQESGGDDHPTHMHDAEEVAARAVERMVLHRRAAGDDFGTIMRDVDRGIEASAEPTDAGEADEEAGDDAEGAFAALLASGMTYDQVVRQLARHVVLTLTEDSESGLRSQGRFF